MKNLILALALVAAPVNAGCTDPGELAFQGLNVGDAIVTSHVIHHGGVEHNPLLGKHPSDARLFATKAAFGALHCAARVYLVEPNGEGSERFFDIVSIGFVGTGFGISLHAALKQGRAK